MAYVVHIHRIPKTYTSSDWFTLDGKRANMPLSNLQVAKPVS